MFKLNISAFLRCWVLFNIRFLNIAIKIQPCKYYYGTRSFLKIMTTKCVFDCNQILEVKCSKSSIFITTVLEKPTLGLALTYCTAYD